MWLSVVTGHVISRRHMSLSIAHRHRMLSQHVCEVSSRADVCMCRCSSSVFCERLTNVAGHVRSPPGSRLQPVNLRWLWLLRCRRVELPAVVRRDLPRKYQRWSCGHQTNEIHFLRRFSHGSVSVLSFRSYSGDCSNHAQSSLMARRTSVSADRIKTRWT